MAAVLATMQHHSAPRGQKTARTRDEVHGAAPGEAPPLQAAGGQYFCIVDDNDAPAVGRPAPLVEVRPQDGERRHCGSGFELLLNVTVQQMGREPVEAPMITFVEQIVGIPTGGGPTSHSPAVFSPVVECISPASVEFLAPAPAVIPSPAPVVEFFSPAPAELQAPAPMVEFLAPAPAVIPLPAEGLHLTMPAVFHAPAPVLEYISPVPAAFLAPAQLEESISPVPAVSQSPAPVVEHLSPAPAVFHAPTDLPHGDA